MDELGLVPSSQETAIGKTLNISADVDEWRNSCIRLDSLFKHGACRFAKHWAHLCAGAGVESNRDEGGLRTVQ